MDKSVTIMWLGVSNNVLSRNYLNEPKAYLVCNMQHLAMAISLIQMN